MDQAIRVLLEIFVEAKELAQVSAELARLPEVIALYEVTGGPDLVAMVETDSLSSFRDLLVCKIMKIQGLRSTTSSVILVAHEPHRVDASDIVHE